ncbi:uncharacterized protein [Hoplias malabaricus]|uniref:uncharacterized protein n=1 Tax=Hoplias malabaricus TaxID=27720 RepID=UPI0034635295
MTMMTSGYHASLKAELAFTRRSLRGRLNNERGARHINIGPRGGQNTSIILQLPSGCPHITSSATILHSATQQNASATVINKSPSLPLYMQLLGLFTLTLLILNPSGCSPIGDQCLVAQGASSVCIANLNSLEEYYSEVTNQPNRLNERSLAAWTYEKTSDLTRVPQVIYEASCLTSHSCTGVESGASVESVPIAIKMPVLRKYPGCPFPSMEFESVNIACICAKARQI